MLYDLERRVVSFRLRVCAPRAWINACMVYSSRTTCNLRHPISFSNMVVISSDEVPGQEILPLEGTVADHERMGFGNARAVVSVH